MIRSARLAIFLALLLLSVFVHPAASFAAMGGTTPGAVSAATCPMPMESPESAVLDADADAEHRSCCCCAGDSEIALSVSPSPCSCSLTATPVSGPDPVVPTSVFSVAALIPHTDTLHNTAPVLGERTAPVVRPEIVPYSLPRAPSPGRAPPIA
ncbi:MAG: hypothetical protein OHK0029_29530 [Armatimonadaceae bacterium]